ncbi:ABC transporter ATP-binding protein [Candidimonas humi]|uniref:ABC transporter ATP-binding protein n=1 Tax=Candidimonas humi TaxID=683355 RepID=A0ABV8NYR6_9BURK|nr:ABC transporter ATP-binding protein [Candidimonas humi]MBV6304445.1 ABC transporter ATP-binding protein [Candidimonas humi]
MVLPVTETHGDADSHASAAPIAIRVSNLSKCYPIYTSPKDRLLQMFLRSRKALYKEFWALRDVSFTVRRGETVAIIGRNGSGKSTLLQMICGTLNPSSGEVEVTGKVAALLELGAGFNPEFTGRENVYMAASLYGLTNDQIDLRFEKIATFADIGEHLDEPVKTYSSGMYVRLAFAVIAHVDADILIVDEALSVGDAVFTQKCMRFIREFQKKGTLLFVSHDMSSVLNLCKRAIWLGNGNIVQAGPAKEIAEAYLQYTLQQVYGEGAELTAIQPASGSGEPHQEEEDLPVNHEAQVPPILNYESQVALQDNLARANGWKSGAAEITAVGLAREDGSPQTVFHGGERVRLSITAVSKEGLDRPILGFLVRDRLGQDLFGENTLPFTSSNTIAVEAGQFFCGEFVFTLPMLPNGQYSVMVSVADGDLYNNVQHHWLHDALILNVSSSKIRWGLIGIPFEKVSLKTTS